MEVKTKKSRSNKQIQIITTAIRWVSISNIQLGFPVCRTAMVGYLRIPSFVGAMENKFLVMENSSKKLTNEISKKKKERLEKVIFWLWKSSEISFCSFFFCYMIQYLKLKHLVGNLLVLLNNMSQHEDFPQTNDQNKNDLKPLKVC